MRAAVILIPSQKFILEAGMDLGLLAGPLSSSYNAQWYWTIDLCGDTTTT